MLSTLALKSSWPEPAKAWEMAPAKKATIVAPRMPAATPIGDPAAASGDAARRRQNDSDDQASFDDFAKDDDDGAEHVFYSAITTPLAVDS